MFLFQRKYRPLLGLDITTSSVKLIELAMAGGQYRVEAYAAEPTPQNAINEKAIVDAEAVGEAIRRAVKRAGAKSGDGRAMAESLNRLSEYEWNGVCSALPISSDEKPVQSTKKSASSASSPASRRRSMSPRSSSSTSVTWRSRCRTPRSTHLRRRNWPSSVESKW